MAEFIVRTVRYPCRNCIYFAQCGTFLRTEPCSGRVTKRQLKEMLKNAENRRS